MARSARHYIVSVSTKGEPHDHIYQHQVEYYSNLLDNLLISTNGAKSGRLDSHPGCGAIDSDIMLFPYFLISLFPYFLISYHWCHGKKRQPWFPPGVWWKKWVVGYDARHTLQSRNRRPVNAHKTSHYQLCNQSWLKSNVRVQGSVLVLG